MKTRFLNLDFRKIENILLKDNLLGIPTRVGLSALAFYKKLLVVFYKRAQTMLLSLMQDWFSGEIKNNHFKKNSYNCKTSKRIRLGMRKKMHIHDENRNETIKYRNNND